MWGGWEAPEASGPIGGRRSNSEVFRSRKQLQRKLLDSVCPS